MKSGEGKGKGLEAYLSICLLVLSFAFFLNLNINFASGSVYDSNNTNISVCGNISSPGTYNFTQSIINENATNFTKNDFNQDTCIFINSSNVILNCNGFNITNESLIVAISAFNVSNVTIKDCGIYLNESNLGFGIVLSKTDNSTLRNNTFISNTNIFVNNSCNNQITGNNIIGKSIGKGIEIINSSQNNLEYNNIHNLSFGFVLGLNSHLNSITNSNATLIGRYAFWAYSNSSYNNVTRGIYNASNDTHFYISNSTNITISNVLLSNSLKNTFLLEYNSTEIVLINCTYNMTQENFTSGDSSEIKRKWWVSINISGQAGFSLVNNANISFFDKNNVSRAYLASLNGSALGAIEEYLSNCSGKYYFNNYTINVSHQGYNSNSSYKNVTSNMLISYSLYDGVAPTVTIISPENEESYTDSPYEVTFSFNATDYATNITNCTLYLEDEANKTLTDVENSQETTFDLEIGEGDYDFYVKCYDSNGNTANSAEWSFEIEDGGSVSGSSSSGGGDDSTTSSGNTYSYTENQIKDGLTKSITTKDRIRFTIKNISHTITANKINSSGVRLIINSTPQTHFIKLNEEKNIELTGDDYYDITIKISSINSVTNTTGIYLKLISENISVSASESSSLNASLTSANSETPAPTNSTSITPSKIIENILIAFGTIITLVIIGIVIFLSRAYYKSKHQKDKPNIKVKSLIKQKN